jgi:hypothetical protein
MSAAQIVMRDIQRDRCNVVMARHERIARQGRASLWTASCAIQSISANARNAKMKEAAN